MTSTNRPTLSASDNPTPVPGGSGAGDAGGFSSADVPPPFRPVRPPPVPRALAPKATPHAKASSPQTDSAPRSHSLEAERGLLGAILFDEGRGWPAVETYGLTAEDFKDPAHSSVFAAVADLKKRGRPVDLLTVSDRMKGNTALDRMGGPAALNRLVDACPTPAYAEYYARLVSEASQRRRLAGLANQWAEAASRGTSGPELLAEIRAGLDAEDRRGNGAAGELAGVSLSTLADSPIDQEAILLGVEGVRYLCRGGTMLFVGPSGVGKSTAAAQQDILWALGRPAFGIAPARPLLIVTVQAENDRGDLVCMARGIMAALNLSAEERATVDAGTRYLSHNGSTGSDFLTFLGRVLRQHNPDLLRIDPLMAYAGGDLTKPETISAFCRNGLNRLATEYGCGIVVCHHTPKSTGNGTNAQARKSWGAFDWQYAAAGGADLANWARAVMVIEALSRDVFAFRAAKRWPGWKNAEGAAEHVRHFQREREHGKVYWHDATPGDATEAQGTTARGNGPDLEALRETAAAMVKTPIAPGVLKDRMRTKMGLTKGQSETLLSLLVMSQDEGGLLVRWDVETFPRRALVGTPEQHKAWQSPELSPCRPAVILQDDKETRVPDLSSHPPLRGGKTGQQDTGKTGRQKRRSKKGTPP